MQVGPYEIRKEIGRGGMGVVSLARAPDGGVVVLKLLRGTGTAESFARFDRERRLLSSFSEAEGFVPLLDAGSAPEGPFIVMPLIPGGTLRKRLDKEGRLEIHDAVALVAEVATTMGRAHERGVIHRDLKPENVMYTADGRPLVADLGLGKHFRHDALGASRSVSLTATNETRGTFGYMAPEQISSARDVGPPADVFSLGSILYECLAGVPAFEGASFVEVAAKVAKGSHSSIAAQRPNVSPALRAVVDRALDPDPQRRFQDGHDLGRALRGVTTTPRTRRGVLATISVVLAAAGFGGGFVLSRPAPEPTPGRVPPLPPPSAPPARTPPASPVAPAPGDARTLVADAEKAIAASDFDSAISILDRALELDPRNAAAFANRGRAHRRKGQYAPALADYEKAVEIAPDVSQYWANCGEARRRNGNTAGAIEAYDKALALDSRNAFALGMRGEAWKRDNKFEKAVPDLEEATRLEPREPSWWAMLGEAHANLGKLDEAVRDFTSALELDPENPPSLLDRAAARQLKGDRAGAIEDYEHLLRVQPENEKARAALEELRR